MRDYNRRRVAVAKSHHASKEELAEAKQRLKEIEEELRQMELVPETKKGEERDMRYSRVLRLRAMRDDFQSMFPIEQPSRAGNLLLALVMTVASFMLCAFCAGGGYIAIHLVNQKPDPTNTANTFWTSMEQPDYATARTSYFSPTLRSQITPDAFINQAKKADSTYGLITSYALVSKDGDFQQFGTLKFSITRGKDIKYTVTLQMMLFHNSWGVSDLGNTLDPAAAGVGGSSATPVASPSANPYSTP